MVKRVARLGCLALLLLWPARAATQPVHVLDLAGTNGWVELPPNIFNDLDQATVEAWVKWRSVAQRRGRFFSYGERFADTGIQADPDGDLFFFIQDSEKGVQNLSVPGAIRTNEWYHIAAVSGLGGMKLFLDGAVIATNAYPGSFSAIKNGTRFRLGRSVVDDEDPVNGQLAEVRVWSVGRTESQIRDNMFRQLTGNEADLVGLWDFERAAADSSPGAHHGTLSGNARTSMASLPSQSELAPWSRLSGKVTDTKGAALARATVRVEVDGTELGRATSDSNGEYSLAVRTRADAVNLRASAPSDLVATRPAVPVSAYGQTRTDLVITPALHIAGKAVALDRKTPHAQLVVELVQPDVGSSRREEAPSSVPTSDLRPPTSGQSPLTSAATNRVLLLDGKSFVELPPNIFNDLTEATVEAWVKWERLENRANVFDFGQFYGKEMWIAPESPQGGPLTGLGGYITTNIGHTFGVATPNALRTTEWFHVALSTGSGGMQLLLNGVLVGTNAFTGSFASFRSGDTNWIGRETAADHPGVIGQIDEFRVWKTQRTADQIRQNMLVKLSGTEPGLFGLWSFDDPADPGRDASPGAHHGKLMGGATTTNAALPLIVFGRITDAAGKGLAEARVEIHQPRQPTHSIRPNDAGEYAFTISPGERCDLFVTTGKLSGYRLGFTPSGEALQKLDWTLAESSAGTRAPVAAAFPNGTVMARTITDDQGNFDFPNVPPGAYQLRAHVLGGKTWFDAGRILWVEADMLDAERAHLRSLEFRLAPFKKGHWTTYNTANGLAANEIRKFWVDPEDGSLWIATTGGVSRFDGKEFTNLTTQDGLLDDAVYNLWREPSGIWWFCTGHGVSRYDPAVAKERAFRNYTTQEGLVAGQIHAVTNTRWPNVVRVLGRPGVFPVRWRKVH
jgi:hypothetical protein